MDKNGTGFQYLKEKLPKISDAKIKEGVFIGPQIRQVIKDEIYIKNNSMVWKNQLGNYL